MAELRSRDGFPPDSELPATRGTSASAMLRLLRPRQWTKNLLVFAALVFAKELFAIPALLTSALAFVAFCLASSSVYIVNDVLDAERDRQHPDKRHRPIAAGEVGTRQAGLLAALLTIGALALSFWIRPPFGSAVAVYIVMTHAYSLGGKHVVILDVMFVAMGFVLRAVGGALAIDVPSSDWFVLCTFFGALFIALSKRRAEILALQQAAGSHRRVLQQYRESTLLTFSAAAMATVLITYALYVMEMRERAPLLALTVPFVLFGVFRYHHVVETTSLGDKPEEVLLRDRSTLVCIFGFAVVAVIALYAG